MEKQSDPFIAKGSQHYNVSVLINHHQDFRNYDTECYQIKSPDDGLLKSKCHSVDLLSQ